VHGVLKSRLCRGGLGPGSRKQTASCGTYHRRPAGGRPFGRKSAGRHAPERTGTTWAGRARCGALFLARAARSGDGMGNQSDVRDLADFASSSAHRAREGPLPDERASSDGRPTPSGARAGTYGWDGEDALVRARQGAFVHRRTDACSMPEDHYDLPGIPGMANAVGTGSSTTARSRPPKDSRNFKPPVQQATRTRRQDNNRRPRHGTPAAPGAQTSATSGGNGSFAASTPATTAIRRHQREIWPTG